MSGSPPSPATSIRDGRNRRLGLLAAVYVAVTACAGPPQPATGSGLAGTVQTVPASPVPILKSIQADQQIVEWQLSRTDNATGRIDLSIAGGGCSEPVGVLVTQTSTSVTITGVGTRPAVGQACTDESTTLVGYVQIIPPIGSRRVIHG